MRLQQVAEGLAQPQRMNFRGKIDPHHDVVGVVLGKAHRPAIDQPNQPVIHRRGLLTGSGERRQGGLSLWRPAHLLAEISQNRVFKQLLGPNGITQRRAQPVADQRRQQ